MGISQAGNDVPFCMEKFFHVVLATRIGRLLRWKVEGGGANPEEERVDSEHFTIQG
jgi:hypothetical protein